MRLALLLVAFAAAGCEKPKAKAAPPAPPKVERLPVQMPPPAVP